MPESAQHRPDTSSACARMAAALAGTAAHPQPHTLAGRHRLLQDLLTLLDAHPECEAATWAGQAFRRWQAEGGDLQKALGLRPRRGGAQQVARRAAKAQARRKALLALVETTPPREKAAALHQLITTEAPAVLVLRQEFGALPTSRAQITRILHATGSECS